MNEQLSDTELSKQYLLPPREACAFSKALLQQKMLEKLSLLRRKYFFINASAGHTFSEASRC